VEDCMTADTREKIENRTDYIFLVIHDFSVHCEEHYTSSTSGNLNIVIFHDMLVTIHTKPVHSVYAVIPKLEYCVDKVIPSIEFILYVILARVLDYHEAHIDKVESDAEDLDEQVLTSTRIGQEESASLLAKLGATTKRASSLLEALATKREIFAALMRYDSLFSVNGMRYIKNAGDHVLKMQLKLSLARDILSDINTLYMAKLNVQLSVVSNEVGVVMKRFGAISTVFLPANLVAGIFGMNVLIPWEAPTNHQHIPHVFLLIMTFMIAVSVLQLMAFRYLKWI